MRLRSSILPFALVSGFLLTAAARSQISYTAINESITADASLNGQFDHQENSSSAPHYHEIVIAGVFDPDTDQNTSASSALDLDLDELGWTMDASCSALTTFGGSGSASAHSQFNFSVSETGSYRFDLAQSGGGGMFALSSSNLNLSWLNDSEAHLTLSLVADELYHVSAFSTADLAGGHVSASLQSTPEPASLAVLGVSLLSLVKRRRN